MSKKSEKGALRKKNKGGAILRLYVSFNSGKNELYRCAMIRFAIEFQFPV